LNLDLRIENHPVLEFKRGKKITFQLEGKEVEGIYLAGSAEVAKVRKGTRGTTILGILVEKDLAMNVRSIRIPERSNR
jgi:hypothetical protein